MGEVAGSNPAAVGASLRRSSAVERPHALRKITRRRVAPTRRCISSFGRAPLWYGGGGWIEATMQHHLRPTSPTEEAARSDRVQSGFKSPVGYQLCPHTQTGKAASFKTRCLEIRFLLRVRECGEAETRQGLNPMSFGFNSRHSHHFALPAPDGKASRLHRDMTVFDSLREYQSRL